MSSTLIGVCYLIGYCPRRPVEIRYVSLLNLSSFLFISLCAYRQFDIRFMEGLRCVGWFSFDVLFRETYLVRRACFLYRGRPCTVLHYLHHGRDLAMLSWVVCSLRWVRIANGLILIIRLACKQQSPEQSSQGESTLCDPAVVRAGILSFGGRCGVNLWLIVPPHRFGHSFRNWSRSRRWYGSVQ